MQTIVEDSGRRIVVRAIGTASPAVCHALAQALPIPTEQIMRSVYQAPAVLLGGLSEEQARSIGGALAKSGLEIQVVSNDESIELGGPDFEVSVHVEDPRRLRAIAAEVARFLGCAPQRALLLLCGSPAVILGRVSEATVVALRARLEPLGAKVDASRTRDAVFDVFVDEHGQDLRMRIGRLLQEAGVATVAAGPLFAVGIPRALGETLYARIGEDPRWRLLDHAFQRFDVVLEAAQDSPTMREAIVEVSGMPETLVPKVLARLPVVLASGRSGAEAGIALARLAEAGGKASADLISLARYDLVLESVVDRRATMAILGEVLEAVDELPTRLPLRIGSLPRVKARWLVHELGTIGSRARMEER
jgi:hypothetical protein